MGAETLDWYNNYCLIGFAKERGMGWHYKASAQGLEPNHYPGAIPVEDVIRRLFGWEAISGTVETEFYDPDLDEMVRGVDTTRQTVLRANPFTVFGVFKESYQIHQHKEWLIETSSHLLDTSIGDLGIANAVLLKKGAVACVQYEVPETIKTSNGIEFRPSMLSCGSLDGSLQTTFKRVFTNVICDNTMANALSEKDYTALKIRHSKYSGFKIAKAREALDIIFEIAEEITGYSDFLCNTKVSGLQFKQYLDFTVPLPEDITVASRALTLAEKEREAKLNLWLHDDRVSPWAGTAWGIVQLNNTYNHHLTATNKGTNRGERNAFQAANDDLIKSDRRALDILFNRVLVAA